MGEAAKAESSFFKIKQKATLIDPTEFDMIKSRHKPNALAARALIRAGTGHKYGRLSAKLSRTKLSKLRETFMTCSLSPQSRLPSKLWTYPSRGAVIPPMQSAAAPSKPSRWITLKESRTEELDRQTMRN